MPAPAPSWNTCRVFGTWHKLDGTRRTGTYKVTIPVRVTNSVDDVIIPAGVALTGTLNIDSGSPSLDIDVPSNSDPDNSPNGWQPIIEVSFSDAPGEKYVIDTPVDGEVNLRTVVLAASIPVPQAVLIRGVPGGLAELDAEGKIVVDQIPDSVGLDEEAIDAKLVADGYLTTVAATSAFAVREPREINLRTAGVLPTNTATQNTTAFNAAIAAAPSGSRLVLPYSADPVLINDALTVPPGKALRFAGLGGRAKIHQTVWPKPVFDLNNADGSVIEDFDLTMTQTRVVGTGTVRDGSSRTYASAVWAAASDITVRRIKATGFTAAIRLTNWNQTLGARSGYASDNLFEDITAVGCDWGIVGTGWRRVTCRNISGDYSLTSGSTDPSHLVYVTDGQTNLDVTVENANAWNGTGGHAYSFKTTDGLTVRGLTSRACQGFMNLESVVNADLGGMLVTGDLTPDDLGSIYMFGSCVNVVIHDMHMELAVSQRAVRLAGTDVTLRDSKIVVPHSVNKTAGDVFVTGTRPVCENVRVVNTGAGSNSAIVLSTAVDAKVLGGGGTDVYRYVVVNAGSTGAILDYDPAASTPKTSVTGYRVASVAGELATARVRPARTVQTFPTSGGTVQVRADQVTHAIINATGSGAITVSLVEPFVGATITYAIANTTGSAMGAVTWTSHIMSGTFTSPAAGLTKWVTFTYDGTSWREVSRSDATVDTSALAPLASPTFTGTVTVPDGSFTTAKVTGLDTALAAKADAAATTAALATKAPTASPTFTGTITVPDAAFTTAKVSGLDTALAGKASTAAATTSATGLVELATTAETTTGTDTARAVTPAGLKAVADLKAPLASPTFTGTTTAAALTVSGAVSIPDDSITTAKVANLFPIYSETPLAAGAPLPAGFTGLVLRLAE